MAEFLVASSDASQPLTGVRLSDQPKRSVAIRTISSSRAATR